MSGKKTLWLGLKQWDIEYSLFRVAEHQVGKLTGHTQEVCGLGIKSLSVMYPHALILSRIVLSPQALILSYFQSGPRTDER